jgi:hypothetical protein
VLVRSEQPLAHSGFEGFLRVVWYSWRGQETHRRLAHVASLSFVQEIFASFRHNEG